MMYKDGNKISIDLLYDKDTTEPNGLEVKVYLKGCYDLTTFSNAISKQLIFFENLYVHFEDSGLEIEDLGYTERTYIKAAKIEIELFNTAKIKNFGDFSVSTLYSKKEVGILLGKVAYPLRFNSLNSVYPEYIRQLPLFLNFNIGDLEVTPNREEILYSEKNIKTIEAKVNATRDYIDDLIREESDIDFDNATEYLKAITSVSSVLLFSDIDNPVRDVKFSIPKEKRVLTFKGKTFKKESVLKVRDFILNQSILTPTARLKNQSITTKNLSTVIIKNLIDCPENYLICDVSSLKVASKDYLREGIYNFIYFISPKENIKKLYRRTLKKIYERASNRYSDLDYDSDINRLIIQYIKENTKGIKFFSNSSVPVSYLRDRKERLAEQRRLDKSGIEKEDCVIRLYQVRQSDKAWDKSVVDPIDYNLCGNNPIDKTQVVYCVKDSDVTYSKCKELYDLFYPKHGYPTYKKLTFVEVASTKVKAIENFTNFIHVNDFLNVKYKTIRKIATAKLIKDTLPHLEELSKMSNLDEISSNLYSVVQELQKYVYSNLRGVSSSPLLEDICKLCADSNFYDENVRGLMMENLTILERAKCIILFTKDKYSVCLPKDMINICVDYILARKLFRPNLEAVKKLRKETIFNIKQQS